MIHSIGIDIVEIPKFAAFIQEQRHKLNRIFSAHELAAWERSGKAPSYLATIFAAKEAVIKAIGKLSILTTELSEIEVKEKGLRQFTVELRGETALLCRDMGIREFHLSATFNGSIATASAIAMRRVGVCSNDFSR